MRLYAFALNVVGIFAGCIIQPGLFLRVPASIRLIIVLTLQRILMAIMVTNTRRRTRVRAKRLKRKFPARVSPPKAARVARALRVVRVRARIKHLRPRERSRYAAPEG